MDINLNIGGILGGALGVPTAFALGVIFGAPLAAAELGIPLVIVGAIGGNILWWLLVGKSKSKKDDAQ